MLCQDEARARLHSIGIIRYDQSRLCQLYYALDNMYSSWFCLSDEDKQVIRADVVAILGRVPKLVTNETIAADAAKAAIAKARVKKKRKSKPCLPTPVLEFIEDPRLRELLRTHAPRKPWCCDDFYQNSPRALGVALRKRYIQLNPPGFGSFIVADLDYANASEAWKDKGLPAPTWATINPKNGHAHLVWALSNPVWKGSDNQKPARLFNAVQDAFCAVLKGDEGFAGLLTKNPANGAWILISESCFATYDLAFLSEHVKLSSRPKKKIPRQGEGLGRNCMAFDELREWAYLQVSKFDDPINFGMAVQAHADQLNAVLLSPMQLNEVLHISRSVSKWTWKHMHTISTTFSEKQASRGKASGKARLAKSQDKRAKARLMQSEGKCVSEISQEFGVHRNTVARWLK